MPLSRKARGGERSPPGLTTPESCSQGIASPAHQAFRPPSRKNLPRINTTPQKQCNRITSNHVHFVTHTHTKGEPKLKIQVYTKHPRSQAAKAKAATKPQNQQFTASKSQAASTPQTSKQGKQIKQAKKLNRAQKPSQTRARLKLDIPIHWREQIGGRENE